MPVWYPHGVLNGGLTSGCSGDFSILGSRCSNADSYHLSHIEEYEPFRASLSGNLIAGVCGIFVFKLKGGSYERWETFMP